MPRVAKDKVEKDIIENVKAVGEAPKSSNRTKKSASVKAVEKDNNPKKTKNKSTSDVAKKGSSSKETKTTKKATDKKNSARRSSTTSKTTRKKKDTTKPDIIEYYDLPFRYNQTTVKILAQTPTNLFIYWDISDADKNKLIDTYGNYFFENTKPVLIITNETMNYTFEIDINDFANSWYLHVKNSNCKYKVELGRRPITHEIVIPNNYVYISSSNAMDAPNDHILFDELQQNVFFKNVKTNVVTEKNILTISHLINMGKIYNVYDLYKAQKDATTYLAENPNEFKDEDGKYDAEKFITYKLDKMKETNEKTSYTIDFYVVNTSDGWTVSSLSNSDIEKLHGIYDYES